MICFDIMIGIPPLFTNFLYNYAHCGSIISILFWKMYASWWFCTYDFVVYCLV